MDAACILGTLGSMEILVDTREQQTKRAEQRYGSFGCPYRRCTLSYGDYACSAVLPGGQEIVDVSKTVKPLCAVERKMHIDELAQCFCSGRQRFTKEFERAKENGARIYLLIENGSWDDIVHGIYETRMNPKALLASVTAFMVRYNANLIFCREKTSGQLIREILYRDLKERLEKGEFDTLI